MATPETLRATSNNEPRVSLGAKAPPYARKCAAPLSWTVEVPTPVGVPDPNRSSAKKASYPEGGVIPEPCVRNGP